MINFIDYSNYPLVILPYDKIAYCSDSAIRHSGTHYSGRVNIDMCILSYSQGMTFLRLRKSVYKESWCYII
jgi:hypothetical protein